MDALSRRLVPDELWDLVEPLIPEHGVHPPGNGNRLTSGGTNYMASPLSPAPAWSASSDSTTWTVRDPDGKLLAIRVQPTGGSTTEYYPLTDNLDNVRAMVAAAGATPDVAYTYSAYGTITSTTGTLNQPYRYGSGYTNATTGLIKTGIRYYDPLHGRFSQKDPVGLDERDYS